MIEVNFIGRFGNNMFQYALGKILSDEKGYDLKVNGIENLSMFPDVKEITGRKTNKESQLTIGYGSEEHTLQNFNVKKTLEHDGKILVNGFFQRKDFYLEHEHKLKKLFYYDDSKFRKPEENALVIHYRLTDYLSLGWNFSPEIFSRVIEEESIKYDKCYVVTDQPTSSYLPTLKIEHEVIHQDSFSDFTFLKNAKKLIVSHSSFSWWAMFLGEQESVFIPCFNASSAPWKINPSHDDQDLILAGDKYIVKVMD